MNTPIYLDTNVIMDFLLDRDSAAYRLIRKSLDCQYFIVMSTLVLEELERHNLGNAGLMFIHILASNDKVLVHKVTEEDKQTARALLQKYNTHYDDALHKVMAKKCRVDAFVTKNVKDFVCFSDITVRRPDEL